jgi:protein-L-isoaspartate(D-aspartate) O-methyltransferase
MHLATAGHRRQSTNSYHARLLVAAAIQEGEHVVHVGAGTGYYTAIMAHLAGTTGRVTGWALAYE